MRKFLSWQVLLGIILISASALVYFIHYLLFRDLHHIFFYLIGDVAFVFIEVLLVTLIIHNLLDMREKKIMMEKLNMVIGAFFSEVGSELLRLFTAADPGASEFGKNLLVKDAWQDRDFKLMSELAQVCEFKMNADEAGLERMKALLVSKRDFLLRLLENQNLLEHETFTNLLWSVFHLTEELSSRNSLNLRDKDKGHVAGDIIRAYRMLILQWVSYMKHLKKDYPYLFSLAVRLNPFDKNAKAEIEN